MVNYSCPHCKQPVDPKARYCGHCGVDIALAAVEAEGQVKIPGQIPARKPMAP